MADNEKARGRIEISPTAIASLASQAVLRSYGVVGMSTPNLAHDIAATLTHDPNKGITVRFEGQRIYIDVYIIIEYGTRIATVAKSVISAVRFNVERAVGVPVEQVNVYVQGLRVTNEDLYRS